jgi:AcrR family transcriptional regulator
MPELDPKRERILEAAGEIFAERGFEQATVRDICTRAGANVAAVNYYFGDKLRLYIEAVKRAHAWKMGQAALPQWLGDAPPEQMLGDFILTFMRRLKLGDADTWQNRLMRREMMSSGTACGELVRDSIRPEFETLLAILRPLLPCELRDEERHLFAFSIVGQCLFYHFADPVVRKLIDDDEYQTHEPERLAEHITAFSLSALTNMNVASTQTGGKRANGGATTMYRR